MKGGMNMTDKTNESKQEIQETDKTPETKSDAGDTDIGKSEEVSIAERIENANLELKKNLEFKAKLLEKEEKILARQEVLRALGGGSPAGQMPAKPAEETPKEYAERVLSGKIAKK